MSTLTFDQVVDTVRQFPAEQQEMLADLIKGWRIESRRREIARYAQEALAAVRSGELKPQPIEAIINGLRQTLEEPEE